MPLPATLDGFRFRSEIDWLKLRVTLTSPSQFRHVQDRLKEKFGKVYVRACDGLASSRRFDITIHNPPGADHVMRDLQVMVQPGKPALTERDVEVIQIEIALDAYIEGSDRARLTEAVGHFVKHLAHTPAGPVLVTSPHHYHVPPTFRCLLQAIASGQATIQIGAKGANFRIRAYLKDYDTIDGQRQNLSIDQHRARIEITLHGDQLPFTTIDGWQDFRFEKLSRRFAMCTPDAPNDLISSLQDRSTNIGRAADAYKRRLSDRRKRAPLTSADSVMNDKIRQALRGLTRRQSCRNSVKNSSQIAVLPKGEVENQQQVLITLIQTPLLPDHSSVFLPQSTLTSPGDAALEPEINTLLDSLGVMSEEFVFDAQKPGIPTINPGSSWYQSLNKVSACPTTQSNSVSEVQKAHPRPIRKVMFSAPCPHLQRQRWTKCMYKKEQSFPGLEGINGMPEPEFPPELFTPIEDIPGLDASTDMKTILGMDREPTAEEYAEFTNGLIAQVIQADREKKTKDVSLAASTRSVRVNIRIPGRVLSKLKRRAKSSGGRYQTIINRILREAANLGDVDTGASGSRPS